MTHLKKSGCISHKKASWWFHSRYIFVYITNTHIKRYPIIPGYKKRPTTTILLARTGRASTGERWPSATELTANSACGKVLLLSLLQRCQK